MTIQFGGPFLTEKPLSQNNERDALKEETPIREQISAKQIKEIEIAAEAIRDALNYTDNTSRNRVGHYFHTLIDNVLAAEIIDDTAENGVYFNA